MRIAALAAARRCCAETMYVLAGYVYASGFDLQGPALHAPDPADPSDSWLPPLVQSTGIPLAEILAAAEEGSEWDHELEVMRQQLTEIGVDTAPAVRWHGRIYRGAREIAEVLVHSRSPRALSFQGLDGLPE